MNKSIDIEKYLGAFPYSRVFFTRDGHLLFLKSIGDGLFLHMINEEQSFIEGQQISDLDFSKQSYWPMDYDCQNKVFYIKSDSHHLEDMNVFSFNLKTKEFNKLTNNTYTFAADLTPDFKKMVHIDRYGKDGNGYLSRVYIRNMETGEEIVLYDDKNSLYRLTWGMVHFSNDLRKVILRVDHLSRRERTNFLLLNVQSMEHSYLLAEEVEGANLWSTDDNLFDDYFYFTSSLQGKLNIYALEIATGQMTPLTDNSLNPQGIISLPDRGLGRQFLQVLIDPKADQSYFEVLTFKANKVLNVSKKIKHGNMIPYSTERGIWVCNMAINCPMTLLRYSYDLLHELDDKAYFQGQYQELVHNHCEFLHYPSFDGHHVPAFLSLPFGEIKAAMIISFYGGKNEYDLSMQIFAEMGIAVFSPAVRGTMGYGQNWRELIMGDLGGNEILDVIWAAKFLAKKFSLKEEQVGVYGGSHGGYATLRALTMPTVFNGVECAFNFGMGICSAGFADLEDFYHTSNIPDWLVQMLGPFEENKEKYRERSPVFHFDKLIAPLLVIHGTNDRRVSPTSMESFIDKLRQSDKVYDLLINEGEGHGCLSRGKRIEVWQKKLAFIEKHLLRVTP